MMMCRVFWQLIIAEKYTRLEDGLVGQQPSSFRCGDNIIAYVSPRTR